MTSLYNRASPPQAHVLRIVEGAIKNAAHAHEEIKVSPRHRRSIAKRAAGTLTAQWPEVLAATRSQKGPMHKDRPSRHAGRHFNPFSIAALLRLTMERAAGEQGHHSAGGAGAPDRAKALPLLGLAEMALWKVLRPLRIAGDTEVHDAALALVTLLGRRRKGAAPLSDGALERQGRLPDAVPGAPATEGIDHE